MDDFQVLARIILAIAAVFLGMSVLLRGVGWLLKRKHDSTAADASTPSGVATPAMPAWFWVMSGLGFLVLAWIAFLR